MHCEPLKKICPLKLLSKEETQWDSVDKILALESRLLVHILKGALGFGDPGRVRCLVL